MTEHLYTYQLDGMPGITLQGVKGDSGERGVRTYTNYYTDASLFQYNVYDLWLTDTVSNDPYINHIYNCNVNEKPIENDYLLYSQSGMMYLYKVDNYTANKDASVFTSDIVSPEYAAKIREYYDSSLNTNDLCLGKLLDTWKQSENTISVVANTKTVAYDAWNGEIVDNKAVKTPTTYEFVVFDVLSATGNNLGKVKVTAEFHKENTNNGQLGSTLIKHIWNDGNNVQSYPYGLPNNIQYTLNYDDEDLGDFEIVIKDWTDATSQTYYSCPSCIKKETLQDYVISLFVYTSNNNIVTKSYIGEFSSDLI